ncbi:MAG: glycerol-3-phosphate 1-O-acyltransferase PlsY [Oscillospiraceae bacterium]|nr:glycerol-3-phosphate 1-O-acyltransferase PlsY [Oscillospiraceae bacterium]
MTETVFRCICIFLLSYALGNPNGAIIVSKAIYRKDVRTVGSGNGGLTNFMRCFGKKAAPLVLLVDVAKGVLAALLGGLIAASVTDCAVGQALGLFSVVLGHCFPLLYRFHGGKGVLAAVSGLMVLDWRLGLSLLGFFLLVVAVSRYVSLGSVLSALSVGPAAHFLLNNPAVTLFCCLTGALVVFMHRGNIARLLQGRENKFSLRA